MPIALKSATRQTARGAGAAVGKAARLAGCAAAGPKRPASSQASAKGMQILGLNMVNMLIVSTDKNLSVWLPVCAAPT